MSETITQAVKSKYGSVAGSGLSTDHEGVKAWPRHLATQPRS